jgi:glycosyltransferase involved in cell wall biosynthesis
MDNDEIRTELAEANKQRAHDFTVDRVARQYLKLYTSS